MPAMAISTMDPANEHRCGPLPTGAIWLAVVGMLLVQGASPTWAQPGPAAEPDIAPNSTLAELVLATLQDEPPATVEELLNATQVLLNVGEGEQARQYFEKVGIASLSDAQLRQLHTRFGSAFFLDLARDSRVAPLGQQLLDRVFSAVRAAAIAPAQLSEAVAGLAGEDGERMRIARHALREAGDWGVAALLQGLAKSDPPPAPRAATPLQQALVELGGVQAEPILAAARSRDPLLQRAAWDALAAMTLDEHDSLRIAPMRWWMSTEFGATDSMSNRQDLAERLEDEIRWRWGRAPSSEEPVRIWFWDAVTRAATPKEMTGQLAQYVIASQIAEDWIAVNPASEPAHTMYLGSVLAALQVANGLDRAIPQGRELQFALNSPAARVLRVLEWSLQDRVVPMAVAACQVLGWQRDPAFPIDHSPLRAALQDPDDRIRFAALMAGAQRAPGEPYGIVADLWHEARRTLATQGERRVMIVDPHRHRAAALASLASQAGWASTVTGDSRDCLRQLRASPDYEWILIHHDLRVPPWSELAQQLQGDPFTAAIPRVLLYDVDQPPREAERFAIKSFPVPVDAAAWQALVQLALPSHSATAGVFRRLERARRIRPWVQQLVTNPRMQPLFETEELDTADQADR